MFAAFLPYRILAFAIAFFAIVGGAYVWGHHNGYKSASDAAAGRELAMSQAASKSLQAANDKAAAIEQSLQATKDQLEVQNAAASDAINAIHRANIKLAAAGKLRDPNYRAPDCGAVPKDTSTPSSDTTPSAGGYLSAELTDLLLSEAYRADQAAIYAKTCHDWAMSLSGK